jgi:phage-related protein
MAVVGEAFIIVKPITTGFESSVRRDLQKLEGVASRVGSSSGKAFGTSFTRNMSKLGIGSDFAKKIESQGKALYALQAAGTTVGVVLSELLGTVGALAGGAVALGGALLSAAPAALTLVGALTDIGIAAIVAKLALSGIAQAVTALNKQSAAAAASDTAAKRRVADAEKALIRVIASNGEALVKANKNIEDAAKDATKAQIALTAALKDGNEQLQQIGFDAEDAALAEKRAGLELEKARETLARVQDLPPNSRARREAQLAYAEADLNLRRAKDKNADLAAEQERLAKTGVEGLDSVVAAREAAAQAAAALVAAQEAGSQAEIDALQKQADAEEALRRAQEDAANGGSAGADPLAGLTESQAEFAKFIASLKPMLQELKEAAAASLLPPLQTAITTLIDKGFPTLKKGISEVGTALGGAANSIANAIVTPQNLDKLATVFTNASTSIEKLGKIAGSLWGIFLSVLTAVDPLLQKFLDWLNKGTTSLDEKLNADPEKLKEFFNEAGRVAAEVGKIIGNIAGGLGNIIKANTGPGTGGQIMLDYFKDITGAFKEFSGSTEGQATLKSYFAGAAENTKSILSNVGLFVKEILKLGDDPNIKKFWDTIGKAAEPFGSILKKSNEGAPALASLLVTITKIIDAFTQTGTIKTFFGTFDVLGKILLSILNNKVVKSIMDFTAPLHGIAMAFVVISLTLSKFGAGLLFFVLKPISLVMSAFKFLKGAVAAFRLVWWYLTVAMSINPFVLIVTAIVALIAIFVVLYKKNEAFRELVQKVWAAIKDAVGVVIDWLVEWLPKAWEGFVQGLQVVWDAIKVVWDLIIAGVTLYISVVTTVIKFVWNVLKTGLDLVWSGIKVIWGLIVAGVTLYINTVTTVIKFVWNVLKTGLDLVWSGIQIVWNVLVAAVRAYINTVIAILKTAWNWLKDGLQIAWNGAVAIFNTVLSFLSGLGARFARGAGNIWGWLTDGLRGAVNIVINLLNVLIRAMNKISFDIPDIVGIPGRGTHFGINIPLIPNLAEGGVVKPSRGGTIARIGEAGRPERIEPLDSDGLSKRDKAMIQLLAGGSGGNTINVYPSAGMKESELAAMVSRQIAFQMRKGGA